MPYLKLSGCCFAADDSDSSDSEIEFSPAKKRKGTYYFML